MRSIISLYNTALARLGGNQLGRENSPDNDSAEATLCRTFFPHVLERALAHSEWRFAQKSIALGRKTSLEEEPIGYPYRYALPGDCIRPIRLRGNSPYVLEGQDLLTPASPATLVYVCRLEDPAVWPPVFADAIAWGLAAELATALVNDVRRQQGYTMEAEKALALAAVIESGSQNILRTPSSWVCSTGGGGIGE